MNKLPAGSIIVTASLSDAFLSSCFIGALHLYSSEVVLLHVQSRIWDAGSLLHVWYLQTETQMKCQHRFIRVLCRPLVAGRSITTYVFILSCEMEEDGDLPKPLVKLRRTPSDTPRPASTPPVIAASGVQDEDDEEKIIAELEVRRSVTWSRCVVVNVSCRCGNVSVALTQDISEDACKRFPAKGRPPRPPLHLRVPGH